MLKILKKLPGSRFPRLSRAITQATTTFDVKEPDNATKLTIEAYWRDKLNNGSFSTKSDAEKFYALSMFPYPSGNLHMGHVRVYTISDTMARFHRMNGKNVFHPVGFDAFGLPAENAAIQRNISPADWTNQNISQMRSQLKQLGCSFDWNHELSTCNEDYYKWTQKLFLMLFKEGLAYQNEALVNWDPVDKTVLADEQVDANGCSWRSGAKVEKKLLKQWFIRTTKFAERLLEGLSDPTLRDWKDIINLQKHWIGECNGYSFQMKFQGKPLSLRVWTESPEKLIDLNAFVVLKESHPLRKLLGDGDLHLHNPFTNNQIPVVFHNEVEFPEKSDVYLASPHYKDTDKTLRASFNLPFQINDLAESDEANKRVVLKIADLIGNGGYKVSSKLQDWLVSRQRYWGTPIPIIHCDSCGAVPVEEKDLPVRLPLDKKEQKCPKCGNENAKRETDTLDTFVDSSWYYLRYLDSQNKDQIYDEEVIKKFMPVDLYIGGKEHAVLHLYYARFINNFLHSKGLSPHPEPFQRLLVQGMVMGRSFREKGSGKYLKEDEVEILDAKKNKAICKETKQPVVMTWEKMSKSKLNGVDPSDMIGEYGSDTTRLIILGDVAPTSHRNWSNATFPGILNWQKRIWLTLNEFYDLRNSEDLETINKEDKKFIEEDEKLFDARNYYIAGATFNYRHSHQLSVAISKMQGLTNSLRRTPKHIIKHGKHFEQALATQIIMLAPMAPHFASELWSKFCSTPNRLNSDSEELQWNEDVLAQRWPSVDLQYKLEFTVRINGFDNAVIKIPRINLDKLTYDEAMDIAFNTDSVTSYLTDKKIRITNFVHYPGIEAILNIFVDKVKKPKKDNNENEKVVNE
ncbi:lars-2 family protein [Megaselia abdita]